jgi:ABC-type antimicrobial peptide transport system permease subunit
MTKYYEIMRSPLDHNYQNLGHSAWCFSLTNLALYLIISIVIILLIGILFYFIIYKDSKNYINIVLRNIYKYCLLYITN